MRFSWSRDFLGISVQGVYMLERPCVSAFDQNFVVSLPLGGEPQVTDDIVSYIVAKFLP